MAAHVTHLSRTCFFQLRQISSVCWYLSAELAKRPLVRGFELSPVVLLTTATAYSIKLPTLLLPSYSRSRCRCPSCDRHSSTISLVYTGCWFARETPPSFTSTSLPGFTVYSSRVDSWSEILRSAVINQLEVPMTRSVRVGSRPLIPSTAQQSGIRCRMNCVPANFHYPASERDLKLKTLYFNAAVFSRL